MSDPPSCRRCRGNPSTHSRLSFRASTRRTQTIYTHPQCTHAPGRDPVKTPSSDDTSSYSPRATRTIGANHTKTMYFCGVFSIDLITSDATRVIGVHYTKTDLFNNFLSDGINSTATAAFRARRRTR